MANVLVIGGTLFIGRALVRRLLARGDRVAILHRGRGTPFGSQVDEIQCDRNDTKSIAQALSSQPFDNVFDNVYDWERGTTAQQVEAAAKACPDTVQRYVFTSSVAAYGEGLDHDEDDCLAPPDHPEAYVANKAETERMLFRLHRESGLPAVTLRPPYIYGPENPFYREAFFWDRLLADRPILLPGGGERLMQFVLADDLARAALLAAETEIAVGRAYNIAHERPITQRQFVEALVRAAGKTADIAPVPRERLIELGGQVFEPPFYFGQYFDMPAITQCTDRATKELGFQPMPFDTALANTFRWYQEQHAGPAPDFTYDDKVLDTL